MAQPGDGLRQTGALGRRDAPCPPPSPPSPSLPWGHYHGLGVLILSQPQAVQHRAGDAGQPVGEPLPNGPRVNILHAAGIDDDIHSLEGKQPSGTRVGTTATSCPSPASLTWKNSAILATWLAQAHLRASGTSSPTCGSQGAAEPGRGGRVTPTPLTTMGKQKHGAPTHPPEWPAPSHPAVALPTL